MEIPFMSKVLSKVKADNTLAGSKNSTNAIFLNLPALSMPSRTSLISPHSSNFLRSNVSMISFFYFISLKLCMMYKQQGIFLTNLNYKPSDCQLWANRLQKQCWDLLLLPFLEQVGGRLLSSKFYFVPIFGFI